MPMSNLSEPSRQASPLREEGEVPESELDPDTRRRLLILQHGQDTQYPHSFQEAVTVPVTSHLRVTIPAPAPAGGWLGAEEEMSPGDVSRTSSGLILEPESPSFRKQLSHSPHFYGSSELMGADALPLVYI
jgi:RNA polymerase II C-terminal domain phosphatase-like 1/2